MLITFIAILSGIFGLLSFIPYFRAIFKGITKPERASWLIWVAVDLIALFSQFAKGASYSLLMVGAYALGDFSIFLFSFKYGYGKFFLKRDIIGLIGASLALILWYLTKEAAVAIFMVIIIDAIAGTLTIIKCLESPQSENATRWILVGIASILAIVTVGQLDFILLIFPAYLILESIIILTVIKLSRQRVSNYVQ